MKERGITLIALIITIVVILILVAVTISITLGENGIIKKAQEARTGYAEAEEKENTELTGAGVEEKINSVVNGGEATITTGAAQPVSFSELNEGDHIIIRIRQNEEISSVTPIESNDSEMLLTNDVGNVRITTNDPITEIDAYHIELSYFTNGYPDVSTAPAYFFMIEGTTCVGQTINKTGWYKTWDLQTIEYVEDDVTFEGIVSHIESYTSGEAILEQVVDIYKK